MEPDSNADGSGARRFPPVGFSMSDADRALIAFWHFQCPECGFSDQETGHHATIDAIWCEVCLEEERHVRLRRWPVDPSGLAARAPMRRRP
jgi:hypothetical protein